MSSVSIRELTRNAGEIVGEVEQTGRPAFVMRRGRMVAVLLPVSEGELEDYVLAHAPEYVASMREADRDLIAGRTREAFSFYDELEAKERLGGGKAGKGRARAAKTGTLEDSPKEVRINT